MIGPDDFINQLRRATRPPRRVLVVAGVGVVLIGLVILALALTPDGIVLRLDQPQ